MEVLWRTCKGLAEDLKRTGRGLVDRNRRICKGMYRRTEGLDSSAEFALELSPGVYIDTGVSPRQAMSYGDNDYPALATHVGHGHFLVACNAGWSGTQEGRTDKICDTWTPALPYALPVPC